MAVICGRNRALLDKLQAKRYASGMHVAAVGFVDNIHEWMVRGRLEGPRGGPSDSNGQHRSAPAARHGWVVGGGDQGQAGPAVSH